MSTDSPFPAGESSSHRIVEALFLTAARLAGHFMAAAVFCLVSVKLVSALTEVFFEWDIPLPAPTIGVLNFSDLTVKFWYLLFVALLLFDAPLMLALQMMRPSRRWIVRFWFSGVLVAALLSIGWIVFWMTVPLEIVLEPAVGR